MEASREIFIQAVDLVVQVGWLDGKRKILGVWETTPEMKAGNVVFQAGVSGRERWNWED